MGSQLIAFRLNPDIPEEAALLKLLTLLPKRQRSAWIKKTLRNGALLDVNDQLIQAVLQLLEKVQSGGATKEEAIQASGVSPGLLADLQKHVKSSKM